MEGARKMADYNQQKQMEMWRDTNYKAQVGELQAAGLNPGLLYGMGGGGGATTGSGGSQMPSIATADAPSNAMGKIMEIGMMAAQKGLIESQTRKNNAEAENEETVNPEKTTQETENLAQGLDNMRQDYEVKKLEIRLKQMDAHIQGETIDQTIERMTAESKQAQEALALLKNERKVSDATVAEQTQIIKTKAVEALLINSLIRAQTAKTGTDTRLSEQQITNLVQENMREWDKMSQKNIELDIQKKIADFNTDLGTQLGLRVAQGAANIITGAVTKGATSPGRTIVEGFNPKKSY